MCFDVTYTCYFVLNKSFVHFKPHRDINLNAFTYNRTLMQISVRLDARERNYIDHCIDKGIFASRGHSLRALLHWYKVDQREIGKLRTENAQLHERLRIVQHGVVQEKPGGSESDLRRAPTGFE